MKQAANALRWCVAEMERRYALMSALGVRNIGGFNRKVKDAADAGKPIKDPIRMQKIAQGVPGVVAEDVADLTTLPFVVVIIDELADLMMIVGKKVEELIARLAQKARASGIHLILATQRPSVDVITGLIKANIPTRIAFQVSAKVDSRTILDQSGAESLLGHGDMLYLPPGTSIPTRVHGAFVSDQEVHRVVAGLKAAAPPIYIDEILEGPRTPIPGFPSDEEEEGGEGDRRCRGGPVVRRGGAHRHRNPQGIDIRGAAAPQDRLQPRGAPGRSHGGGGSGRAPAVQRQSRNIRRCASRGMRSMQLRHLTPGSDCIPAGIGRRRIRRHRLAGHGR